jgi:hypothetical protein
MLFREGSCGEGTNPLRRVVEDVGTIDGWNQGGVVLPTM